MTTPQTLIDEYRAKIKTGLNLLDSGMLDKACRKKWALRIFMFKQFISELERLRNEKI